jgi:hypothetical protein
LRLRIVCLFVVDDLLSLNWWVYAVAVEIDAIDALGYLLLFEAGVTCWLVANSNIWAACAAKRVAVDVQLTQDRAHLALSYDALFRAFPCHIVALDAPFGGQKSACSIVCLLEEELIITEAVFQSLVKFDPVGARQA